MDVLRKKIIVCIHVLFELTYPFVFWLPIRIVRYSYLKLFIKHLGRDVFIGRNIDVREPWNIVIGDNCVINKNVVLDGRGGLVIGSNVDIAQEVNIWSEQHDYNDDYHVLQKKKVVVHDFVWIASRATVLPGVTLGEGAVVACGAVVTKNINTMVVVGGVPAKEIGERKSSLSYKLNYKNKYKF